MKQSVDLTVTGAICMAILACGGEGSTGNASGANTNANATSAGMGGASTSAGVGGTATSAASPVSAGGASSTNTAQASATTGDASSASTGGNSTTELSGPTPAFDPDLIVSVGSYEPGQPQLTVWRRYKDAVADKEQRCTTQVEGSCALFTCSEGGFEGLPVATGFGEDFVDAGTVGVTYQRSGTEFSAELTTDDSEPLPTVAFQPNEGALLGGELLSYSVSGEDIPALSRKIPFPSRLTTTTPGAAADPRLVIAADGNTGLSLEWEGGSPGVLYQVTGGSPLLYCEFDSTVGHGEIPARLLGQLAAQTLLATLTASAWRGTVDGYDVSFAAGTGTLDPAGLHVYLEVL